MSANNSGSGGVRNLRAMFENKASDQSASSPVRDRSPNNSESTTNNRPLSKVRANFVPVDRPGELGQIPQLGSRKTSDVSSTLETRDSETTAPESIDLQNPAIMDTKPKQTSIPLSSHTSNKSIDGGLGSILKGSAFEPGTPARKEATTKSSAQKHTSSEPQTTTPLPVAQKKAPIVQETNGTTPLVTSVSKKMQSSEDKSNTASAPKLKTNADTPASKPVSAKASTPKTSPTSPSISKQKTPIPSASPAVQKLRGGPAKITGVMQSAKKAEEDRQAMALKNEGGSGKKVQAEQKTPSSAASPAVQRIRGGPAKVTGVMESAQKADEERKAAATKIEGEENKKSEAEHKPKPKVNGTVKAKPSVQAEPAKKTDKEPASKPKVNGVRKDTVSGAPSTAAPKSPGKSVRLPSAATASTAASAAKVEIPATTEPNLERKVSKGTSTVPLKQSKAATSTTTSQLAKKASKVSLAPKEEDRPKSRVSASKPDEGFLARMMKPTASTTSKAHDKLTVSSPPRARATSLTKSSGSIKGKPPRMSLRGKAAEHNDAAGSKPVTSNKTVPDAIAEIQHQDDPFEAGSENREKINGSSMESGHSVKSATKDASNIDNSLTTKESVVPDRPTENGGLTSIVVA